MKKSIVVFGVLLAFICCTLAFAATRQGSSALFEKTNAPKNEINSITVTEKPQTTATPKRGMVINEESVRKASSRMVSNTARMAAKADSSASGNVQIIVEDLWNSSMPIATLNNGGTYDSAANIISFNGNQENSNQIFSAVTEDGNYGWTASYGQTYIFSGTLASDGYAEIQPCVVYYNGNGLYVANSTSLVLNEANGFTSDYSVSASGIPEGYAIMVAFIINNSTAETSITSSNNQFYYSYKTLIAQAWDSENSLAGLGLENFTEGTYTVTCEDGETVIGLYYDGILYFTGINTPAEEVVLPEIITIDGALKQIEYFGYGTDLDWSGAPNLKSLDISPVGYLSGSFQGSAVTDLYIGQNTDLSSSLYGVEDIYLHIPFGANRNNYTGYGFKRVLVGEELPGYPETSVSDWVIAGENEGDYFGITTYSGYYTIAEIFTDKESVELPVATPANDGMYYIRYFGKDGNYNSVVCQNALALKSVTVPESYMYIRVNWNYSPILNLHMQGDVPETAWNLNGDMNVYVADKSYFSNYETNSSWSRASILPDGWEFDWMTVNVGRKGEFAQTYIEMTDANWDLGMYVKVTGALNATDLQNINNLTNLRKLDLTEAEFTTLPSYFLQGKKTLQEVYLPENLTEISGGAFYGCSALTLVSAPGALSIGNSTFYNCSKLQTFDLSKVQIINSSAFNNCSNYVPTTLASVKSIGDNAFYNTAIEEAVIPEGITAINSSVFERCKKLSTVVLPASITSIENSAFSGCSALTSINLPEGISSIDSNAFSNCSSIEEITLPSTLQSIGYSLFYECTSLTTLKCKAIVPPLANGNFTSGMDLNHCTLYVAPFAIDAYRAAENWSAFYIMKPLNEPVKNIYINRPMTFDLLSEDNAVLQDNPNMTLDYYPSRYENIVGQLSASGDGTLSAGIFSIFHSFADRDNNSGDYRTTLVNNAENMRADSVMCSVNLEKNRWHFISFQYDVQMRDVFGLNNTDFVIRQYNSENRASGDGTASNWEDVPADGVLKAGKGYIIQAANNTYNENRNPQMAIVRFPSRNTVTKNNLFTSKNIIVPLEEYPAEFAHNRSWNLVGNPYPCYYDMHCLMDDFYSPIVLWRGSSYQAYSPIDDDIILRPNEAFFVQRPLDAEQMVFGADGRMHFDQASEANVNPGIFSAPALSASVSDRAVFNFNIAGCGKDDRARIVINEEASMEYEINRDAAKFFAEAAEGVEIYVDGNIKYDICERPLAEGVATLGTRIGAKGEYTISLSGRNIDEWKVMLTDTYTGTAVDLTAEAYTFDAECGSTEGRFIITFKAPGQSSVTDVNVNAEGGSVRIVNIDGITLFEGDIEEFKATAPAGVYIVVSAEKNYKIVVK